MFFILEKTIRKKQYIIHRRTKDLATIEKEIEVNVESENTDISKKYTKN